MTGQPGPLRSSGDAIERWAVEHRGGAMLVFGVTGALLLGVPSALGGVSLWVGAVASAAGGMFSALVTGWLSSETNRSMAALDRRSRQMIVQAIRRGEAVQDERLADLATAVAEIKLRELRVVVVAVPIGMLLLQMAFLLHLGRSLFDSIIDWRLATAVFTALAMGITWPYAKAKLNRAIQANRRVTGRPNGDV